MSKYLVAIMNRVKKYPKKIPYYFKICHECSEENYLQSKYCGNCGIKISDNEIEIKNNLSQILFQTIPCNLDTEDFVILDCNNILLKNDSLYIQSFYSESENNLCRWNEHELNAKKISGSFTDLHHVYILAEGPNQFFLFRFFKDVLTSPRLEHINSATTTKIEISRGLKAALFNNVLAVFEAEGIKISKLDENLDYNLFKTDRLNTISSIIWDQKFLVFISNKTINALDKKGLLLHQEHKTIIKKILSNEDYYFFLDSEGSIYKCELTGDRIFIDNIEDLPTGEMLEFSMSSFNGKDYLVYITSDKIILIDSLSLNKENEISISNDYFLSTLIVYKNFVFVQTKNPSNDVIDIVGYDIHPENSHSRKFSSLAQKIRIKEVLVIKKIHSTIIGLVRLENNEKHFIKIDI